MKNILIICAHPDDEVLGMGGTILKHIKKKDKVHLILGSHGRKNITNEIKKSCDYLKITNLDFLKLPDQNMESIPISIIVKKIKNKVDLIEPEIVYTHFNNDLNKDHRIISQATIIACRRFKKNIPNKLLFFEIPSSTEQELTNLFKPNYFINISQFIEEKCQALSYYKSEIEEFPHPRSIIGIKTYAKFRGMQVNLKFVEAFMLYYEIKND